MEKDALKKVHFLSQLPNDVLEEITENLKARLLLEGEVLFNEGDPGDELFIVEEGKISIYVPDKSVPRGGQSIRIIQEGEMFGEMALIDREPRSLSARAIEPSRILTLRGDDFKRIVGRSPEMAFLVMTGLSDRLRYTTDFLEEVRCWIQRITEGDYQIDRIEKSKFKDQTLTTLAAEFTQMAVRVQEREELLREEVNQLRIEIDQVKRKEDTQFIMESDYYKSLKEEASNLRKKEE